ncbi:MAG TPA: transketolase C-terminal domain-containing protein, partial [Candidatus Hydrogenedentes bacterium]|nr:transketolase C-terminal domain-containing protein [Candidatus Hydrogenedentota bacterium]
GRSPITRGQVLREGSDAVFLTVGPCAGEALTAAEQLALAGRQVGVIDARWVKPLDTDLLDRLAGVPIMTVEENTLEGGFGSAVLEYYECQGMLNLVRLRRAGVPDRYIQHATRREQLAECGLDAAGLYRQMQAWLEAECPAEPLVRK